MNGEPDAEDSVLLRAALATRLSRSRLAHVERVVVIANRLAELWGVEGEPVLRAAWLHDCARELRLEEQQSLLLPSRWDEAAALGWHGPAGAVLAWQAFEETDLGVLDAIKYHSVPLADESDLAKLIFVADKLEAGPAQLGSTMEILPIQCPSPDLGLLYAVETRIRKGIDRRRPLHGRDVAAHAVLLERVGRGPT
ncbi:MAG: hypothetical protein CL878_00745 [Dehalococcoidia bacterium]|nr:hypothetical protein [Dehalococcoidia bacterium]